MTIKAHARKKMSFVFQNIDGDGLPTQTGDFVAVVEAPKNKRDLFNRMVTHDMLTVDMNYRMCAFLRKHQKGLLIEKVSSVLVHEAQQRPGTPRRSFMIVDGTLWGWPVRIVIGHAINSAWRSLLIPTTWLTTRRKLWNEWHDKGTKIVNDGHDEDRLVIMLCDGNRAGGQWSFPGMVNSISHGPDEVFMSRHHKSNPKIVTPPRIGARTGNGRVTHASIGFDLLMDKKA